VLLCADNVRLEGVRVTGCAGDSAVMGDAVLVYRATGCELRECRVDLNGWCGVMVRGEGASGAVRGGAVGHNGGSGVGCDNGASLKVDGCVVERNGYNAVESHGRGCLAVVVDSVLRSNKHAGLAAINSAVVIGRHLLLAGNATGARARIRGSLVSLSSCSAVDSVRASFHALEGGSIVLTGPHVTHSEGPAGAARREDSGGKVRGPSRALVGGPDGTAPDGRGGHAGPTAPRLWNDQGRRPRQYLEVRYGKGPEGGGDDGDDWDDGADDDADGASAGAVERGGLGSVQAGLDGDAAGASVASRSPGAGRGPSSTGSWGLGGPGAPRRRVGGAGGTAAAGGGAGARWGAAGPGGSLAPALPPASRQQRGGPFGAPFDSSSLPAIGVDPDDDHGRGGRHNPDPNPPPLFAADAVDDDVAATVAGARAWPAGRPNEEARGSPPAEAFVRELLRGLDDRLGRLGALGGAGLGAVGGGGGGGGGGVVEQENSSSDGSSDGRRHRRHDLPDDGLAVLGREVRWHGAPRLGGAGGRDHDLNVALGAPTFDLGPPSASDGGDRDDSDDSDGVGPGPGPAGGLGDGAPPTQRRTVVVGGVHGGNDNVSAGEESASGEE